MKSHKKIFNFQVVSVSVLLAIVSSCEKIDIETYCTRVHQKLVCTGLNFGSADVELQANERFYELTVNFGESDLVTIPRNLFGAFGSAYYIEFVNCKIKVLHKWNFESGESAEKLNLRSNEIQKLSSEVFATMVDLDELNLQNNLLNEFEVDSFKGLSRLSKLFLGSNNITQLPTIFDSLIALKEIHLNDNHIEVVSNDIFKFNTQLDYINFAKNNIKSFSQHIVRHLTTSFELDLSHNPIGTLNIINADKLVIFHTKIETMHITEKLYDVVARHNPISEVVFTNDPMEIQKLDLSYNRISNITNITKHADNIWYLDLSHNPIGQINVKSFSKLTSLRERYLSGTNILGLDYGSFPYRESQLAILDISQNNLKYFDLDILSYQSKLQYLYLDGNQLTELNYENLKRYFLDFNEIGLTDNNWNCTFLKNMVKYMHHQSVDLRVGEVFAYSNSKTIGGLACSDVQTTTTVNTGSVDGNV